MSWIKPGGVGSRIRVSRRMPTPSDGVDGDVWFVLPPSGSVEVPGSEGWESGTISSAAGVPDVNPTRIRTIGSLPVVGGYEIQLTWQGTYEPSVFEYAADGSYLGASSWLPGASAAVVLHPDAASIRLLLRTPGDDEIEPSAADTASINITYGGG